MLRHYDLMPITTRPNKFDTKAVNTYPSAIPLNPDQFQTQEKCDKAVETFPFVSEYCHDEHKTHKMCDKVVKSYLPALKVVPDC